MKRNGVILILLIFSCNLFADSVSDRLAKIPLAPLPFACTKRAPYPNPAYAFPRDKEKELPLYTYHDLGLKQKNTDPNTDVVIYRKFKPKAGDFDLVALDLNVSEWGKRILTTYRKGELIDNIEVEVSWAPHDWFCIKQWRIDANEEVIVTWLKVDSPTPVSAFSNFDNIQAQRIDIHYKINADGKFQEIKQVKYQPQTYTRTYLTNMDKNLWQGNEVPVK